MNALSIVRTAFAGLLLTGSVAAVAEQPSYSYVEVGGGYVDVDVSGVSGETGFFGGFSAAFGENFYGRASFEEYDFSGFDLQIIKAGLGYRMPLNTRTDVNFELGYNEIDVGVADADGVRGTVGVRSRMSPRFEGGAYAGYVADSSDGDVIVGLEGNALLTDRFAVTFQFESYDFDVNIGRVGLRLMF